MGNGIELKKVEDILKYEFYIPSYQRGYRWNKQQITDLIGDLSDFSQKKENDFYCLQPIVVKKMEGKWEVIDGQQRLTTIYVILKYLKKELSEEEKNIFSLEFETREDSKLFLENIDCNEKNEENIDYYYISSALQYVKEWFNEEKTLDSVKEDIYKEIWNKLLEQTKVIWYQVDDNVDSIDIFTRINLGKIPLTNSELIKALFLKKDNFSSSESEYDKEKMHLKQLEIANEWDQIEYTLQNDEFWYFICNGSEKYENRIEFIFNMMAYEKNKELKLISENHNEYFSFLVFSKLFKEEQRITKEKSENYKSAIDNLWLEIKKYFMTFEEWFNNREIYHLLGYLVTVGIKIEDIKKGKKGNVKLEKMTKSEFKKYLKGEIKNTISAKKTIENFYYNEDKEKIKNILLLFNVISILENKNSNLRFSFDRFKIEKWDIEHIHAVASRMPSNIEHRKDWLAVVKEYNDLELKDKIDEFIKNDSNLNDDEAFTKFYTEILNKYGGNENIDNISNLTLLDAETNRSYKNAIFPIKRNTIIKNDKNGTFIPPCTKNVFLKYYSEDIKQITFWGDVDRKDYLNEIKKVLSEYLPN